MLLVQLSKKLEPFLLLFRSSSLRRVQIDYRITAVTKRSALVRGRHITVAPVRRAVDRTPAIIREDDESRQILVFGSETVGHPASDARMSRENTSSVHLEERRSVRRAQRVHRANQRKVVGMLREIREQIRYLHPALPVLLELPERRHQPARRSHRRTDLADAGHRLALASQKHRLRIERIDLAHASVTEDRDHRLCPGREMRLPGRERRTRLRQQPVTAQEVEERDSRDPAAEPVQKLSSRTEILVHWR